LQAGGEFRLFCCDKALVADDTRWVYIIEGIFSIVIAIAVWFGLPTDPTNAWFLNAEEREMMRFRNAQRKQYLGSEKFDWAELRIALTDPKLYLR
jgi:hypothetical protein